MPSAPITGKTAKTAAGRFADGEYHDIEAALYNARIKSKTAPTDSFRITQIKLNHRIKPFTIETIEVYSWF
ncbi:Uncharacterised protein [uncultured archaeon]|nr:Uncharacterised protein [uncultured archaeon]